MVVRTHGQAYAAGTSGVGVTVTHENSARTQGFNETRMRLADSNENEVGVTGPIRQAETA